MKQSITTLLTLVLCLSFVSCDTDSHFAHLDEQPRTRLHFSQLPDTIKHFYLKSIEPRHPINDKGDTLTIFDYVVDTIICLDQDIKKCDYEIKWKLSFVDKYIFQIDDKTLTMNFNSNTINPPYILYNKEFYFVVTKSIIDKDEIRKAEFGKFNLTTILSK